MGELMDCADIYMDSNLLNGAIPTEFGKLSKLQSAAFDRNHLDGTLPSELGQASSLLYLTMHGNQMQGTLPSEFGLWDAVFVLDFGANNLNGTLAPEFVGWRGLEFLDLHGNKFTGSPRVLAELPLLRQLYIENTEFDNLDGLCDEPSDWDLFVANECFADRYDCSCCTECCIGTDFCMPL
mmetsp:Transcript_1372/g.3439  ORF Transcript_1372/g.3439 Transcript_1372/m.3439 type:complete len:181 (+) Transcript_1372:210-752(+)